MALFYFIRDGENGTGMLKVTIVLAHRRALGGAGKRQVQVVCGEIAVFPVEALYSILPATCLVPGSPHRISDWARA